jgi:hypothetical protein
MSDFDPVGTVAFFRERHRVESITTAKVLGAMTPDMMAFRPHVNSSTFGSLAWTIVRCLSVCNQLTSGVAAEVSREPPPLLGELVRCFDLSARQLGETLLDVSQKDWSQVRKVTAGEQILLDQPMGQIFWLFHVDSIHHRGQLSIFLRQFGAKVPSIYGPSGDSRS